MRVVRQLAEHLIALLFVEAARLKLVGVEPEADTAALACNVFRELQDLGADILAAEFFRHHEKFDEALVIGGLAPDAAGGFAGFGIVDQDRERLIVARADRLFIIGEQRIPHREAFGFAWRIGDSDLRRRVHASPAVSNMAALMACSAVLPAHTTNCIAG